jgi:DNA repair protein RadC
MNANSDSERFSRYHAIVNTLLAKDSFQKSAIFESLKHEKPAFIGRVIAELIRDGYLVKEDRSKNSLLFWTAQKERFDPGKWIDRHVFTATVKRSPSSDRPRERLLRLGASELKNSELLAILVRSGIRGESALQAGEKLGALFGNDLKKLFHQSRAELKQVSKAIGESAYCQIMAGLELGKRFANQEEVGSSAAPRIRNTSDTLDYCREHFIRLAEEAKQEEFHVILLDEKHKVLKSEQITVGLLNKSLAHPREVFRPAIRESASALILIHNHPSGDPTPSAEDRVITRELKKAAEILGFRILDHVIVSKDKLLSMVDEKIF